MPAAGRGHCPGLTALYSLRVCDLYRRSRSVAGLADAYLRALAAAEPGNHKMINSGSGVESSVRGVPNAIREVTRRERVAVMAPRRPGNPAVLVGFIELAASARGWSPQRSLTAMVDDAARFAASSSR